MAPKENRGAETPSLFFEDCALLGKGQELAAQLFLSGEYFSQAVGVVAQETHGSSKMPVGAGPGSRTGINSAGRGRFG